MAREAAEVAAAEALGGEHALDARMQRTCCVDSRQEAERVAGLLMSCRDLRDPETHEPVVFGCDTEVSSRPA